MKKILVMAFISLFAVSAMAAVDVSFNGKYEVTGYVFGNYHASDDSESRGRKARNWSGIYHDVRLIGKLQIDPKMMVGFRAKLADNWMGSPANAQGLESPRNKPFDRMWAEYQLLDDLKLTAGRTGIARTYFKEFGSGFFSQRGEGAGTADMVRVDYSINEDVKIYTAYEKYNKGYGVAGGANMDANGEDTKLFALGANIKLDEQNLAFYPVFTYFNNRTPGYKAAYQGKADIYAGYVAAHYLPASGFNAKVAAAVSKDAGDYDNSDQEALLWGAYGDFSYVMPDFLTAGLIIAYGSEDKDAGMAFDFGEDFDKTQIIDDGFRDGDHGVQGMLAFIGYAELQVLKDLKLGVTAAYYQSITDGRTNYELPINYWAMNATDKVFSTEDTKAYEVDLYAKYQLTPKTVATLGVAWAQFNDISDSAVGTADMFDSDPVYMGWLQLLTNF